MSVVCNKVAMFFRKVKTVTETLGNLGMFAELLPSDMKFAAVTNGSPVSL